MGIFSQEKEGFLREKFTEVSIPLEGTLSQQVFKKIVNCTQNYYCCGLPQMGFCMYQNYVRSLCFVWILIWFCFVNHVLFLIFDKGF